MGEGAESHARQRAVQLFRHAEEERGEERKEKLEEEDKGR
jgi:hypothetical protein